MLYALCKLFFGLSYLLFFHFPIHADTIFFRDGNVKIGQIESQDPFFIKIRDKEDRVVEYNRQEVLKILYRDLSKEEIHALKQENPHLSQQKKSLLSLNYMAKNSLFPGWGYWDLEKPYIGLGYSALFLISLGYTWHSLRLMNGAKRDYRLHSGFFYDIDALQTSPTLAYFILDDAQTRKIYQNRLQTVQSFSFFSLMVYSVQLFHSYWLGHNNRKELAFFPYSQNILFRIEPHFVMGSIDRSLNNNYSIRFTKNF